MSQATVPNQVESPAPEVSPVVSPPVEPQSFDYRPVSMFAVISAFFGLISIAALISEIAVLLCLFGMIFGGLGLWKIRRAEGAVSGRMWAMIGLFASVIFFVAGVTRHVYAYVTEVPEGYTRVHFSRDISRKQFVINNGVRELHPDVKPLDGEKIFIKGFMYNTQKQKGLEDFVLLKDNGKCCFGGNPKPYDMMVVKMPKGTTVDKMDGLVSVAGTLKCYPQSENAVYVLNATYVERARTPH